jgi:hypothetical protein
MLWLAPGRREGSSCCNMTIGGDVYPCLAIMAATPSIRLVRHAVRPQLSRENGGCVLVLVLQLVRWGREQIRDTPCKEARAE